MVSSWSLDLDGTPKGSACHCYLVMQGWSASLDCSFSQWSQEKHNLWWALPIVLGPCGLEASPGFSSRGLPPQATLPSLPSQLAYGGVGRCEMDWGWKEDKARVFLLPIHLRDCLWQWLCLLHNTRFSCMAAPDRPLGVGVSGFLPWLESLPTTYMTNSLCYASSVFNT